MLMNIQFFLLITGLVLLIKGADVFVDACIGFAERLKIPAVIIGLTVVAFGTSMPEAVISITAAARGTTALAVGNAVGSNMFNLLIVVGMCGVIKPLTINFKEILKDFSVSVGATVALLLMTIFCTNVIPRYLALVLLTAFVGYMVLLIRKALKAASENLIHLPEQTFSDSFVPEKTLNTKLESQEKTKPLWLTTILAVFGSGLMILGGQITVGSAVLIAGGLGVSERIIGLTIVAAGTSLPELVVSLVAYKKNETGMVIGNVIGSNIFNILFVLGLAGVVAPLMADMNVVFDMAVLVVVNLITLLFVYTGNKVGRLEGAAMVLMYITYIVFICLY
jgi:cation:H+ antiporter